MFFWNSCFFDDPTDIGNLISGSSAFSKSCLNIWKFMVHILLMPGLENFEHYFASMWDECNYAIVREFFDLKNGVIRLTSFLWLWFQSVCPLMPSHNTYHLTWVTLTFDCVDHNKLWKFLKEMRIPDHLTSLLRNLYAGQEATVRTGHGTTGSK